MQRAHMTAPPARDGTPGSGSASFGASAADDARNRLFGAGLDFDPYPVYAALRDRCPVHEGTITEHFPVPPGTDATLFPERPRVSVYSHRGCEHVLRDAATYSSSWYDASLRPSVGHTVIGMDAPEHRRQRLLLQPAFSRAEMEWWAPEIIQPIVDGHLDRIAPLRGCDLYHEIGAAVPVHTIAAALGLPVADRDRFFDWAVGMTSAALTPEARAAAARELGEYAAPLVAERRAHPSRDLISLLVTARVPDDGVGADGDELEDDRPLSDEEIVVFVRLLVIAGAGTTYRAYGNLMYLLLTHPEQYERVRADRSLVPNAIEESLRIEQPLAQVGRLSTRPADLEGVAVPAASVVNLNLGAANHDPRAWPDPDRFDVERPRADRHLSFGFGAHRCLGIHLARAELTVLLNRTMDRLHGLRLDPDAPGVEMTGLGFRMPTYLPVLYDA